jgi:hypothetical protein
MRFWFDQLADYAATAIVWRKTMVQSIRQWYSGGFGALTGIRRVRSLPRNQGGLTPRKVQLYRIGGVFPSLTRTRTGVIFY